MGRRKIAWSLAASGWLVLFAGCSAESRQWILTTFFDGADTPPPPTRRVRRDLLQETEELKRQLEEAQRQVKEARAGVKAQAEKEEKARLPAEQAKNWPELAALLPEDSMGGVDWVKALKSGAIAPRPGIDPKASDQPVLPITVERTPPGQEAFKAVFPHDVHTQWLSCESCHPTPFQMQKGATPINMGLIYGGQACGACHGKVAFPVTACARCHPAMAGGK